MKNDKQNARRIEELEEIYNDLSDEQKSLAFPLIENLAFIEIQLNRLQILINEEGTIDEYQNGSNQRGKKQSATLQSYTSLLKSYNTINARLEDMLSNIKQKKSGKEKSLEDFLKEINEGENETIDDISFLAENDLEAS